MQHPKSRTRLQLASARADAGQSRVEVLPAETVIERIDARNHSHQMLTPSQMREIKAEQAVIEQAGATEVVRDQLNKAAERAIQNAELEGECQRAQLRSLHSEACNELTAQAGRLGGEVIANRLQSHEQQLDMVQDSRCLDEDKSELAEIFRSITEQRIRQTAAEHGVLRNQDAE